MLTFSKYRSRLTMTFENLIPTKDQFKLKQVLPIFKKSEKNLNIEGLDRKYHNVDGEQSVSRYPYVDVPSMMVIDAYIEKGLQPVDINGETQIGAMLGQTFSQAGQRVSTNNAFIQPIRYKRRNLIIKVESEVYEILINEKKVAYGVKYTKHGKNFTAYAKKEVIVSAGTINSPKLLMLSGVGPKEHLTKLNIKVKEDLAVGENLQDHVTYNGYLIALPNKTSTLVDQEVFFEEIFNYKQQNMKTGPLSATGPVSTLAFFKTDCNLPAPDIQIQGSSAIAEEFLHEPSTYSSVSILPFSFYNGLFPRIRYLTPKSRGKLLLNSSNPYGDPLIFANYFSDPTDLIPLIKGTRFFLNLENTKAFKSRGAKFVKTLLPACKDYEWGTDEYTVCLAKSYSSTTYHPVGTCKMGPESDKKAVVNPRLQVYGITALRVIDASIMPFVVRGNTNAAVIMIGEQGAAFLMEDWQNKRCNK